MQTKSIRIIEKQHRIVLEAELIVDLTEDQAADADKFFTLYRRGSSRRHHSGQPPEHDGWSWQSKRTEIDADSCRFFGIRYEGVFQGMMQLKMIPDRCRLDASGEQHLLYVEHIESAPWNLFAYAGNDARYAGIGVALISVAMAASAEAGYGGRIGLHSIPQSENFYRNAVGLTDMGPDLTMYDLRYFEATDTQVQAFLSGEEA